MTIPEGEDEVFDLSPEIWKKDKEKVMATYKKVRKLSIQDEIGLIPQEQNTEVRELFQMVNR